MYFNRDLSWLEFNYRVLQEAACEEVPLYERIKFLAIFSSNFDEFFSIRYPVILAISKLKTKTQKKIDNAIPDLEAIQKEIEHQFNEFEKILTKNILPLLEEHDVVLYYGQAIKETHIEEIHEIFLSKVLSFLQPIFLNSDVAKRFMPEANKLYMIISLRKEHEDLQQHAIIKVPSDSLKRFYTLSKINGKDHVVFIDDIIRENVRYIFPGFIVTGVYSIKFNRNQDLDLKEDYRGDILKIIKKQLLKRGHGLTSRFLYENTMPRNVQLYIASLFGVGHQQFFSGGRYANLADLATLPKFKEGLTYKEWKPISVLTTSKVGDIFKKMEEQTILLHFPYQSYNPILFFFNQAAIDPDVQEIYVTLYRLAADSLIANAIISAAKNGKKVTVFIELKARFDEENNITWSEKMKKAGVRIIYSIPGIKVHTKIALVIKNNKAYSIISTGNFNEMTARFYSDHSLLTVDEEINIELLKLFHFLERREKPFESDNLSFKKLLVSQFNMIDNFENLVNNEIKKAKSTGHGFIKMKINNLEEPGMIDLLYKASKAGVTIHLIVRSVCCLVPQIIGLSENIQVKRIVDRYLEHTRIFIFGNDENAKVIIGSSDWMTRNLYHRIELCTPVEDNNCRKELLDYFNIQWMDTDKAEYVNSGAEMPITENMVNAQHSIYSYLKSKQ